MSTSFVSDVAFGFLDSDTFRLNFNRHAFLNPSTYCGFVHFEKEKKQKKKKKIAKKYNPYIVFTMVKNNFPFEIFSALHYVLTKRSAMLTNAFSALADTITEWIKDENNNIVKRKSISFFAQPLLFCLLFVQCREQPRNVYMYSNRIISSPIWRYHDECVRHILK